MGIVLVLLLLMLLCGAVGCFNDCFFTSLSKVLMKERDENEGILFASKSLVFFSVLSILSSSLTIERERKEGRRREEEGMALGGERVGLL